jgi:hypothetical protein
LFGFLLKISQVCDMRKENTRLVTLEVAKLARLAGFDDKCDWAYCYDTQKDAYYENYDPNYHRNSILWEKHYAAPTREEFQLWLQKQGVFVIVDVDQTNEPKFVYKVNRHFTDGNWDKLGDNWSDLYYRYEQALEDGLLEGVKLLA